MLANPLGLLALLALPAVVALHLFRRRFHPRPVSAVFLWASVDRSSRSGRQRVPLHRSPSFWLELLAALLLALAVSGIRACGGGTVAHIVVVLDGSASMSATGVHQAATAAARTQLRRLPRNSRATLIQSGPRPAILAGPGAPRAEALLALDDYQPTALQHDLLDSVELGWELAGGAVTLITDDHTPDAWPASVTLISLGTPSPNVGITSATRQRRAQGDRVFVMVQSFLDLPTSVTVSISEVSSATPYPPQVLSLEPAGQSSLSVELTPDTGPIEVTLTTSEDSLALDDRVILAPQPPRTLGIASALSPSLNRLLGLGDGGARWAALTAGGVQATPETAHLLIGPPMDQTTQRPGTWLLSVAAPGPTQAFVSPFLIDRGHPLMDGLTLQDAIWSGATRALPGSPLISAGNQVLLSEEVTDTGHRIIHLNIDPRRSNLHQIPDWPIFLANLATARRRALPGLQKSNVLLGESVLYVDPPAGEWSLDGPGGQRALSVVDDLLIDDLNRPGLYALSRDGEAVASFAMQFLDAAESDLRDRSGGERPASVAGATLTAEASPLDSILMVLAMVALCLDWWFLWREERAGG